MFLKKRARAHVKEGFVSAVHAFNVFFSLISRATDPKHAFFTLNLLQDTQD
jgi:hypothetical protein